MLRLRTPITEEELAALMELAQQEMRNAGDQAHFIIRQELKRLGLLCQEPNFPAVQNNTLQEHSNLEKHHE